MSAAIWSYLPQLYDMLRLNSDVWLLARHGNNRTPLGERVDVIYSEQKSRKIISYIIFHLQLTIKAFVFQRVSGGWNVREL